RPWLASRTWTRDLQSSTSARAASSRTRFRSGKASHGTRTNPLGTSRWIALRPCGSSRGSVANRHAPSPDSARHQSKDVEQQSRKVADDPPKLDTYAVMRIERVDFAAVGLELSNERPGTTGVVAVDFRHWEIPGS